MRYICWFAVALLLVSFISASCKSDSAVPAKPSSVQPVPPPAASSLPGVNKDVYLVMGGFHMGGFSVTQINKVIADFQQLSVQKAAPCHCSGDQTRRLFAETYGDDFMEVGVGKKLQLAPAQ